MALDAGKIFVQLKLDDKEYKQRLSDDLTSTEATTKGIEAAWKALGAKTEQSFNLQAKAAQNAYTLIKNSAQSTANDIVRAEEAKVAKINYINQQLTKSSYYETLGIKSTAAIKAQRDAVIEAANKIQSTVQKNSQDWINVENAKNAKLKELNKEMVGDHDMSMAAMMRAVLRLYAVYYVGTAAFSALSKPFIDGFKAVEEYNTSVASLAAMMVTFSDQQEKSNLETKWKNALVYSSSMVPVLEQIAAKTLLSGQETTALANAFARSGVFLEKNNKAQIDAFTNISNALPLMTQGQEIMRQINTEIRSLMTGANEQSSMLLITLKSINPNIEKDLKLWRAQGTVLEHIGDLLQGFAPATALLEYQWTAVKSTIETTYNIIMRDMMKNMYTDIIDSVKSLNDWLLKNKDEIIKYADVSIGALKAIGAAVTVYLVGSFAAAIPTITSFISTHSLAIASFVSAHPVLIATAAAIGGITMAFQYASAAADKASRSMSNYVKSVQDMNLSQINQQLRDKQAILKSLEDRYKTSSFVSSASIKQEIDDTKYLIATLQSRARVASDVPDAVQKANNTARNMTKMTEDEIRVLHKQTREEFQADMNAQIKSLREAGASQIEIEKYISAQKKLYAEKFGKADVKNALKAAKLEQREEEQVLAALTKQNKTYYDATIQNAKSAAELKIKQGEYVFDVNTELYDREQAALDSWYNKQVEYINRSFSSEKVKQEKLNTLYDEYSKKWDENLNNKAKKEEEYAQKYISIMAEVYKTINPYSDEALAHEVANIEREFKIKNGFVKKGSEDEIAVIEAKNKKIENIYSGREAAILALYEKTKTYAENASEVIESLAIDEYNKAMDLTNNKIVAEKAYTDFIINENIKRLKAGQNYSDGDAAYLLERMRDAKTIAQASYDTTKAMVDGIQDTFSTVLFDTIRGDLKSFSDYWDSFLNSLLKKFTDTIAQMVVEWALGVNNTGGGNGFLSILSAAGGLISGGMGVASSLASASSVASSAAYTASAYSSLASSSTSGFAMLYHDGGIVGDSSVPTRVMPYTNWSTVPRYHNGLLSDEFPAVLQKGETVIPRGKTVSTKRESSAPININIMAADAKSFDDMCKRNPGAILNPITTALQGNKVNKQWKALLQ